MRPTKRMLIRPSPRIFSRAGRRGALVMRSGVDGYRQHAGWRKPQRLELAAVELGVAEREVDVADERRQLTPSDRRQAEEARRVGREERRRGNVVILQHPRAVEPAERVGHRRGQREVKDGDVAPSGCRIRERPHVGPQVVVHGQRVEVGLVALAAEHLAHPTRAVSDGVAAMGRGHPLVDDHRRARARGSGLGVRGLEARGLPESDP